MEKIKKNFYCQCKKWLSKIFLLIVFIIFLFIGRFFIIQSFNFKATNEKILQVSFLDVGQGDAAFIKTPKGKIILIDGGPDNLVLWRLGEKMSFYERGIEAIIISHFHDDHVLGLIEILRRYRVTFLIFGPELESSLLINLLVLEAEKNKTEIIKISSLGNLSLDSGCEIFLFNPLSLEIKKNDNNSLLTKLSCGETKFLFSGDNEEEVERALLLSPLDLSANVFKASHHGSKTSNKVEFLRTINPEIMAISAGKNNRFNHPALETLKNAAELEIEVLRTDERGNLDFLLILNSD